MCRLNPLIMGLVGVLIAVSGLPGCSRPAQGWVQQIGEGGRAPTSLFQSTALADEYVQAAVSYFTGNGRAS